MEKKKTALMQSLNRNRKEYKKIEKRYNHLHNLHDHAKTGSMKDEQICLSYSLLTLKKIIEADEKLLEVEKAQIKDAHSIGQKYHESFDLNSEGYYRLTYQTDGK